MLYFCRETDKRPNAYLEGLENRNINKLLESAEPMIHECITTFTELKQQIWLELTNANYVSICCLYKGVLIKVSRGKILKNGFKRGESAQLFKI